MPGLPGGNSLFFASPKKSKQKKGDPAGWVPTLRFGQPAVLDKSGVPLELAFGSDNRGPLSAFVCAPRPSQNGGFGGGCGNGPDQST